MATTSERGLGAVHVADKKRLKAALREGEPCWRCGQPMYHWQDLDRDHVIDRAHGGTDGPAVLAHAACNRSAGARAGNLGRPYTISVATAPPATCKACGKQYRYAARNCEMCGSHYHPTYGEQRTCGRVCGVELQRRNRRAKPKPKPKPPKRKAVAKRPPKPDMEAWAEAWFAQNMIPRPAVPVRQSIRPRRRPSRRCSQCGSVTERFRFCDSCLCTSLNAHGRRCGNAASTEGRCEFHAHSQRW